MHRHLSFTLAALITPLVCFGQMRSNEEQKIPIECTNNFDTSLEFLMWTADVDGAPFVVKETFPSSTLVNKKTIELDGKWEPGLRLGVGYHFGFFDQWDLMGTWTYYHGRSENESRTANGSTEFLRQGWSPFLGPIVTFAKGHWSVNMNLADLELGRSYVITPKLTMHPHAGIRGAWIDFSYLSRYTGRWNGVDAVSGTTFALTQNTNFKGESDFGGGGLVAGSGLRWSFDNNWAFCGNLTASLLYGQFHVKEHFNGADFSSAITLAEDPAAPSLVNLTEKYRERFNRVRGTLDLLFGLEARAQFNKDRSRMTFFLGYELSKLFRFNELFAVVRSLDSRILSIDLASGEFDFLEDVATNTQFHLDEVSNDIGFQGLTAKVEFEF